MFNTALSDRADSALPRFARSLVEQVRGLAAGEVTASAMTQHYLDAIARDNPRLNIFWHVSAHALADAQAADTRRAQGRALSPFDGIAVAIKDNIDVAGMPCTAGLLHRRETIAEADAFCVQQLRALGLVILGKLSMHEGALGADNDNPHYGACHNPHRFGFTPGGSSGGSAAALAAGLCAASLGTDTMGSVRIPAAYCGVSGFKPSYGQISVRGVVPACFALDHVGVLAHSPDDLALLSPYLFRRDGLDPYQRDYAETNHAGALRLAYLVELDAHGVDPAIAAHQTRLLAALDLPAQPLTLSLNFGANRRAGLLVTEADMAITYKSALQAQPESFSPALLAMLQFAQGKSAPELAKCYMQMQNAAHELKRSFDSAGVDVLITPTTPQTAFAFGAPVPANQADLTSMANLAGWPALSIPSGYVDGLPVGVQLIARSGFDRPLLALAQKLGAQIKIWLAKHDL